MTKAKPANWPERFGHSCFDLRSTFVIRISSFSRASLRLGTWQKLRQEEALLTKHFPQTRIVIGETLVVLHQRRFVGLPSASSTNSTGRGNVLPLIGIAAAKTLQQKYARCCLPVDGRGAYRTMRCAHVRNGFGHLLNLGRRPGAKAVPLRVIAAPKFLSLPADRALGAQIVIAAVEFAQLELERHGIVRTSDEPVLPKLLHDLMRLFC